MWVADEVSSDERTRCVLNRLISNPVSLAENRGVSVVRFAIIELCNGGTICLQGSAGRAGTVFFLYRRGRTQELISTLYK